MILRQDLPLSRLLHFVANRIVLFFLIDILIAVGYVFYDVKWIAIPELPVGLIGTGLTIFLGFRIKAAYDRWWEARILWGAMVNWARSMARRCEIYTSSAIEREEEDRIRAYQRQFTYWLIAYVYALRSHLRRHESLAELEQWIGEEGTARLRNQKNVPVAILRELGRMANEAFRQGWIDSYRLTSIEDGLAEITNVQGGCERIKNTPIPRQFDYFPRLFTNAYCMLLPIGLVSSLGLLTPVASSLVAFMFLSLESFGSHIETPFENTINDIPMTALARTIEIDLKQGLGENRIPAPMQPVGGFLF